METKISYEEVSSVLFLAAIMVENARGIVLYLDPFSSSSSSPSPSPSSYSLLCFNLFNLNLSFLRHLQTPLNFWHAVIFACKPEGNSILTRKSEKKMEIVFSQQEFEKTFKNSTGCPFVIYALVGCPLPIARVLLHRLSFHPHDINFFRKT